MRAWSLLTVMLVTLIFFSGCISGKTIQRNCEQTIAELPKLIEENTKNARLFEVTKVLDGDTIELSNGQKVRFIGINAPEKGMKWSAEATNLTKELTKNGIYLQKDVEEQDIYNRWLRYAFTNSSFINAELIRQGLATTFPVEPNNKYAFLLSCLEKEAKENKRGLWSAIANYSLELEVNYDAPGDDNNNLNGEFVVIKNIGEKTINLQNWSIKDQATHFYYFKAITLEPQESLIIYTGEGFDSGNKLFWNSKTPIWNNAGDIAYLFDANGDLVTFVSFP
jgi:micrococcal nuclease